jgi:sarcosine oxidase, subunit beta
MLTPHEAKREVPELDTHGVVAASFNKADGVVFPWPFVWGYAQAAVARGVRIETFTDVEQLETSSGAIKTVHLARIGSHAADTAASRAKVTADVVVNACGAWSPEVARLAGVELPNKPHRHEICSTEPLKPWLGPLVADLSNGLYFSQSTRGEIVGGIGLEQVPQGVNQQSSHEFLGKYAAALTRVCPIVGSVKVLRQWAGCYDLTPDANPIVGYTDDVAGFYQASGFMGHGFMMAPVMGKRIAEHIVTGNPCDAITKWNLRRFREGRLLSEGMIIG